MRKTGLLVVALGFLGRADRASAEPPLPGARASAAHYQPKDADAPDTAAQTCPKAARVARLVSGITPPR